MKDKEELQDILPYEFNLYFHSRLDYMRAFLLRQRRWHIWRLQKILRRLEYLAGRGKGLKYAYYSWRVNTLYKNTVCTILASQKRR